MTLKKLSAILVSVLLLFALAGCGSSSSSKSDAASTQTSSTSTDSKSTTSNTSASSSAVVQYSPGQTLQLGTNIGQIDIRIDSALATSGRLNVEIDFVSHATYETNLTQFISGIKAEQNGTQLSEVTATPIFEAINDGMNDTIEPADDEEVEVQYALSDTSAPVVLTFTTTSGATGSITLSPIN